VNVVLLGAPGAGKGTQAQLLAEWLGVPHVASGDLFRENLRNETELGLEAKKYIDNGDLVPDVVTIAMVVERLSRPDCAKGVLLDGFPRTVVQAEALDEVLAEQGKAIDLVPYIRVGNEILVARLAGRWTCRKCESVYHEVFNPPERKGVCDECGGELYQRPDDTPETQRRRIEVYLEQTSPLIEFYRRRGLLVEIDGEGEIEVVERQLRGAIDEVRAQ
jgi:adenylate kinase